MTPGTVIRNTKVFQELQWLKKN